LPQLRLELGLQGDGQLSEEEMEDNIRGKRAEAFDKVCAAHGLRPRDLADIEPAKLADMMRGALNVQAVETQSLPAHVADYLADL
jgi:hypothetical protein